MLRAQLLSAAALGAALAATPALAQRDNSAIQEMRREQANPSIPAVPQQNRVAAEADAMGRQDAGRWLSQAEQAIRRGQMGQANELLERAETRLLTRSTLATMADQPAQDPIIQRIAEARRALQSRDRSGALSALSGAQASLGGMGADSMTGAGAGMPPAQGGGGYGGTMMRDRGTGSSTMNRADAVGPMPERRAPAGSILAQGAGGGGGDMGSGSGGLQGSTPGSPGTGNLGSTPQSTLGLGQQPAQGSAVPLAPGQGGRAAPLPGSGAQVPGGTGQMPGDNQRGAPTTGVR